MAVGVHVAPHPDALVDGLIDRLAVPPADPFAAELVAVPTRGIERWLTQRIALGFAERGIGDGVVANVQFPSPHDLVQQVLLAVPDLAGSATAWQTATLTSHVLTAIDRHAAEPWLRIVQRYVDAGGSNRRDAAAKIARLFATYARRRPGMIQAWAAGDDIGPDGNRIADGHAWQPRLWRTIRRHIDVPSIAELLPGGLDPIRTGEVDLHLPDRLSVYGLTATDPLNLQVLDAIGEQRDVSLYVLHPSPGLWQTLAVSGSATTSRATDPTVGTAAHPLLASWGRDSRELQLVLAAAALPASSPSGRRPGGGAGLTDRRPDTLLTQIQNDIRANRPPTAVPTLDDTDRSVQIHVTYGPRRQAEVVRDAILHLLADDPTLEPRDIVIMTPDLATFAPLLEAAFPTGDHENTDGLPDLRLRIADRSPAAVNPLVRFAATVVELAGSRLEANTIRELVTRPVVQERFGFDLDTAAAISKIIDDSNISWGLDADHRRRWGAGTVPDRTWGRGLDRALTGVFYSDDPVRVIGNTVPLDGVEGQDAIPVGLLAAIMDRIVAVRESLNRPLPTSQWAKAITDSVKLLAAPAWEDEWQLGQLERLLAETFPDTTPDPTLSLAEATRAIAGWTETRPSPLHFRTGDVTVCTLVPMRSVPYRVVCLLGMDDERFPRSSRRDGDDLLLGDERVGDFDRSSEDRQLLLDALMAAGDHLVVTYAGRDQLTNSRMPAAVPIAELQDTIEDMAGAEGLKSILTEHPLQSFSSANFTQGALGVPGPFGFDPAAFAGAAGDTPAPAATSWPEPEPIATLDLDELIRFLQHPAQRFMQHRVGFAVPKPGETPDDTLPADLNPLAAWAIKERLANGRFDGYPAAALAARIRAGDDLPPGSLGDDDLADAEETAELLTGAARHRGYDRMQLRPYRGSVTIGAVTLEGSVLANPDRAHLARVTASRVKGKHRLRGFTELAFLSAIEPDITWTSFLLGRRTYGNGHLVVTFLTIGANPEERRTRAMKILTDLVDLYREGQTAPLPLPCETGYLWQRNKQRQAAETWEDGNFAEALDPAHVMLFGGALSMEELQAAGFEHLCVRLWGSIIPQMTEKSI